MLRNCFVSKKLQREEEEEMNGRGGCCIARYEGAGPYGLSKVDRIMLRFRPIAPKPAAGRNSGGSAGTSSGSDPEIYAIYGRGKRKYSKQKVVNNGTGEGGRKCNQRKRRSENRDGSGGSTAVVTLPLLPESPDSSVYSSEKKKIPQGPFWLSFDGSGGSPAAESLYIKEPALKITRSVTAVSYVTVECVTETWPACDGYGLGENDEERKINLEKDTCPGFISDGQGRVTWTNEAYRKMVLGEGSNSSSSMMVWLVMKDRPMLTYRAFSCRVRLQHTCQNREGSSTTLPCDVWRMVGGGFAWRLDVNAALSLGR